MKLKDDHNSFTKVKDNEAKVAKRKADVDEDVSEERRNIKKKEEEISNEDKKVEEGGTGIRGGVATEASIVIEAPKEPPDIETNQ